MVNVVKYTIHAILMGYEFIDLISYHQQMGPWNDKQDSPHIEVMPFFGAGDEHKSSSQKHMICVFSYIYDHM